MINLILGDQNYNYDSGSISSFCNKNNKYYFIPIWHLILLIGKSVPISELTSLSSLTTTQGRKLITSNTNNNIVDLLVTSLWCNHVSVNSHDVTLTSARVREVTMSQWRHNVIVTLRWRHSVMVTAHSSSYMGTNAREPRD